MWVGWWWFRKEGINKHRLDLTASQVKPRSPTPVHSRPLFIVLEFSFFSFTILYVHFKFTVINFVELPLLTEGRVEQGRDGWGTLSIE